MGEAKILLFAQLKKQPFYISLSWEG